MKTLRTSAIVLSRTDYAEADRIIAFLTPEQGKLRLIARGVRKVKSKLAGGIELFSVSDISYIPGKREIGTLVSTRLLKHYGSIIQDIDRVQLGYELIKQLDRATADHLEPAYFELLEQTFAALDDSMIDIELIRLWFVAQLLRLGGHSPNLSTDTAGVKLQADEHYAYDPDNVAFTPSNRGNFRSNDIKVLRLLFSGLEPAKVRQVVGALDSFPKIAPVIETLRTTYLIL